jgi:hypothetical protein
MLQAKAELFTKMIMMMTALWAVQLCSPISILFISLSKGTDSIDLLSLLDSKVFLGLNFNNEVLVIF